MVVLKKTDCFLSVQQRCLVGRLALSFLNDELLESCLLICALQLLFSKTLLEGPDPLLECPDPLLVLLSLQLLVLPVFPVDVVLVEFEVRGTHLARLDGRRRRRRLGLHGYRQSRKLKRILNYLRHQGVVHRGKSRLKEVPVEVIKVPDNVDLIVWLLHLE